MTQESEDKCSATPTQQSCCCRVESVLTLDEEGRIVLPKQVREKAGFRAGDRLAIVTREEGDVYCITLYKADQIKDMVKDKLGPVIHETDNQ